MKKLFGGSESKQQSTSTPIDMTPEDFKGLRPGFAEELTKLLNQGGTGDYDGPLTAGLTPGEQQMLDRLRNEGGTRRALLDDTLSGSSLR